MGYIGYISICKYKYIEKVIILIYNFKEEVMIEVENMYIIVFFVSLILGIAVDIVGLSVGLQFGSIVSISLVGSFIVYELRKNKDTK